MIEGFWNVEDLRTPGGVKINGRACKRERLMPDDELVIGKHRYRINFTAPKYAGVGKLAKTSHPAPKHDIPTGGSPSRSRSASPAPAGGVLGRLVPVGGGPDIPLLKPHIKIGRKPPCDIVLEYRSISAVHCGLDLLDGYWQALDLDSRNGIRVGGVAVKKAWVLPRARLSLAEHRFALDYVAHGSPPADALPEAEESSTSFNSRSLIDKLGLSEQDLERTVNEGEDDTTDRPRRWEVMNDD
jgi:hypothetical protein